MADMALYALDAYITFAGPVPERDNRAAPEVSAAQREAIEAVREVLVRHGFTLVRTGHGAKRLGTFTPASSEERA